MEWAPLERVHQYGPLYEAVRRTQCWVWRWGCLAVLTVVAVVTGASAVPGGGCTASLAVCSVLLVVTAILLAVVRPYALPSENVLNPLQYV